MTRWPHYHIKRKISRVQKFVSFLSYFRSQPGVLDVSFCVPSSQRSNPATTIAKWHGIAVYENGTRAPAEDTAPDRYTWDPKNPAPEMQKSIFQLIQSGCWCKTTSIYTFVYWRWRMLKWLLLPHQRLRCSVVLTCTRGSGIYFGQTDARCGLYWG